jgi:hypothetical protein
MSNQHYYNDRWVALPDGVDPTDEALQAAIDEADKAIIHTPPPTLDDIKTDIISQVKAATTRVRAMVAEHADQYKLSGYGAKFERAIRIVNYVATQQDIDILQLECESRMMGESLIDLANKQIVKGERLSKSISIIDGREAYAIGVINDAVDEDAAKSVLANYYDTLINDLGINDIY